MSDNIYFGALFGIILFLLGVLAGVQCFENNANQVRREAVLIGAAQYVSNEKGISRFEWNKK